ncbi:hypothetical protein [Priestia megaterium]
MSYTSERVVPSFFTKEPFSSDSFAFVYKNGEEYRVVRDGQQLTTSELRKKKYSIRYRVQMGTTPFDYTEKYQTADGGRYFEVTVKGRLKLVNPVLVVKHEITDINSLVKNKIFSSLQHIVGQRKFEAFHEVKPQIQVLVEKTVLSDEVEELGYDLKNLQVDMDISQEDKEFLELLAQKERDRILKEVDHENLIKNEQEKIEIENIRRAEEERREKARQAEFSKQLQAGVIPAIIASTSSNAEAFDKIKDFVKEQQVQDAPLHEQTIKIIKESTQLTDEQKVALLTNMKANNQSMFGIPSGQQQPTSIGVETSSMAKLGNQTWKDAKDEIAPPKTVPPKKYDEGFGE